MKYTNAHLNFCTPRSIGYKLFTCYRSTATVVVDTYFVTVMYSDCRLCVQHAFALEWPWRANMIPELILSIRG